MRKMLNQHNWKPYFWSINKAQRILEIGAFNFAYDVTRRDPLETRFLLLGATYDLRTNGFKADSDPTLVIVAELFDEEDSEIVQNYIRHFEDSGQKASVRVALAKKLNKAYSPVEIIFL